MKWSGVAADHEPSITQETGQLAKIRRRRHFRPDAFCQRTFSRTPGHERLFSDVMCELAKTLHPPLLVAAPRTGDQKDPSLGGGRGSEHRKVHMRQLQRRLERASELQVPFDDVFRWMDPHPPIAKPT